MYGLRKVCKNTCFNTQLTFAIWVFKSKLDNLITLWGSVAQQYLLREVQVYPPAALRVVREVKSLCWSRRYLLEKVGQLFAKQVIFYHMVLQVQKTRTIGVSKNLYHAVSGRCSRNTRSAAGWQIRIIRTFSFSTFKKHAIEGNNRVPEDVRVGTTATVKHNLRICIMVNIPIYWGQNWLRLAFL